MWFFGLLGPVARQCYLLLDSSDIPRRLYCVFSYASSHIVMSPMAYSCDSASIARGRRRDLICGVVVVLLVGFFGTWFAALCVCESAACLRDDFVPTRAVSTHALAATAATPGLGL